MRLFKSTKILDVLVSMGWISLVLILIIVMYSVYAGRTDTGFLGVLFLIPMVIGLFSFHFAIVYYEITKKRYLRAICLLISICLVLGGFLVTTLYYGVKIREEIKKHKS